MPVQAGWDLKTNAAWINVFMRVLLFQGGFVVAIGALILLFLEKITEKQTRKSTRKMGLKIGPLQEMVLESGPGKRAYKRDLVLCNFYAVSKLFPA